MKLCAVYLELSIFEILPDLASKIYFLSVELPHFSNRFNAYLRLVC